MVREVQVFKQGDFVHHGSYGQRAAYGIKRFQYAAYPVENMINGFWELLSIENPPEGEFPIVIHVARSDTGHTLFCFEDVETAHAAWGEAVRHGDRVLKEHPQCRRVQCLGVRQPWFFCPWIEITMKPPSLAPDNIAELWIGVFLPTSGVSHHAGRYTIDGAEAMHSLSTQRKAAYDWYCANLPDLRHGMLILTSDICREV